MAEQGSEVTSATPVVKTSGSTATIVDSTTVTITNQKLNGNNFLPRSRDVELFITGRGKKDYLSDKMTIPTTK